MTARTHDYLWLLVDASAWALFSALVTDMCVKFKQGGAGVVLGSMLLWFCAGRRVLLGGGCCEERNLYLPRSSRATLEKMNSSVKQGIMQVQTLVCGRRCR